ncbi:hypothetical protein [Shimazuella soli]|nr:hypothetical protein [Shimazuella soli]
MQKCKNCGVSLEEGEAFEIAFMVGKYCENCIKQYEYYLGVEAKRTN